jgi:negative regulator of flagellin synthesis FlgM
MNVSNKDPISLVKTYADNTVDKAGKGSAPKQAAAGRTDEVRLSEFSQDIQKIEAGLKSIQDVREERVRELKARIQAGTYDVSGKDIAEKMIDRIVDLIA